MEENEDIIGSEEGIEVSHEGDLTSPEGGDRPASDSTEESPVPEEEGNQLPPPPKEEPAPESKEEKPDKSLIVKSLTLLEYTLSYRSDIDFMESHYTLPVKINKALSELKKNSYIVDNVFYFTGVDDAEELKNLQEQDLQLAKYLVLRYKNHPEYFKDGGSGYYYYDKLHTLLENISKLYDNGVIKVVKTLPYTLFKINDYFIISTTGFPKSIKIRLADNYLISFDMYDSNSHNLSDTAKKIASIAYVHYFVNYTDDVFELSDDISQVLNNMKFFVENLKSM